MEDQRGSRIDSIARRRADDGVRIFSASETAVVAAERTIVVAVLDVEIMAKDHTAVTEVRTEIEQIVVGRADLPVRASRAAPFARPSEVHAGDSRAIVAPSTEKRTR